MNTFFATTIVSTMLWMVNATAAPVVSFAPSCRSHLIHTYEETSRDFSYLEFQRNQQPCYLKGMIGGEHQTYINVLGFAGDRYSVSLSEQVQHPSFSISGEGIKVFRSSEKKQQIVEIEAMQTFFSIEVYAYPYGEYQMTIKKI